MASTTEGGVVSSVMKEFRGFREKMKNEEDDEAPFRSLVKSTVLQECRVFHDSAFVKQHPKRCCQQVTKLLCLLTRGETFSNTEVSDIFFAVTKLFQSKDGYLRRLVFLFLKEVAEATAADEIIIVVQSLCKDMTHNTDLYRANALRVLAKIIDASMLGQIERYIKQAVVDKNDLVSSSALVAGLHLYNINPDVVRRWVSEVQEALASKLPMVQFHALALFRTIKQKDRQAVTKLVTQLRKANMQSPLGLCLLIRYSAQLLKEDPDATRQRAAYDFLDRCLRYSGVNAEMVNYEAARAICEWPGVSSADLSPAMTTLHIFLTSGKATQRFVAVRTLSKLALKFPLVVARCNKELESLITDSNRTVATLAITTLLKTGGEASVERLLKEIGSFMGEIGDEFKVVVVKAIRELCLRYPAKYRTMFLFLLNSIREEGGLEFKKCIVEVMIELVEALPNTKADGLLHLCEFIEDCEFPVLSARVLHLLGDVGPSTATPQAYVRYMYNRVILEVAQVRAAAVSALAKFAARVDSLRPQIIVLLQRCQHDDDDAVRDRAAAALRVLSGGHFKETLAGRLPRTPAAITRSLRAYQMRPAAGPVTFDALPHVEEVGVEDTKGEDDDEVVGTTAAVAGAGGYAELYQIPEFSGLGAVFKSGKPVELTESELEYLVSCVMHVMPEHVVFQFNVTNTVAEQVLENVTIEMECSEPDAWELVSVVPAARVPLNTPTPTYVCMRRTVPDAFPPTTFACTMRYLAKDVDPDTGEVADEGDEDEYEMEDVEVAASDFMSKTVVTAFKQQWEAMGKDNEVINQYALEKTVEQAVTAVTEFLGMQLCGDTGNVPAGARQHMALLSGVFLGGVKVLARLQVVAKSKEKCVMKLGIRSSSAAVSQVVADCIQ